MLFAETALAERTQVVPTAKNGDKAFVGPGDHGNPPYELPRSLQGNSSLACVGSSGGLHVGTPSFGADPVAFNSLPGTIRHQTCSLLAQPRSRSANLASGNAGRCQRKSGAVNAGTILS